MGSKTKVKVEWLLEVDSDGGSAFHLPFDSLAEAREIKLWYASAGSKSKILRNEYKLINTSVVR